MNFWIKQILMEWDQLISLLSRLTMIKRNSLKNFMEISKISRSQSSTSFIRGEGRITSIWDILKWTISSFDQRKFNLKPKLMRSWKINLMIRLLSEILKSRKLFQSLFLKMEMFLHGGMELTDIWVIRIIKLRLSQNKWYLISKMKIRKLNR
jgi:hypothetical protein